MTPPRLPLDPGAAHAVAYVLHLLDALREERGNVEATARRLNIAPRTLHRHLDVFGLRAYLSAMYPMSDRQPRKARGEG